MAGTEQCNEASCCAASVKDILKESYGDKCKVIADVGDFAFVVSVKLCDDAAGATIKFQLPGDYPSTECTVRLVAPGLSGDAQKDIEVKIIECLHGIENPTKLQDVVEEAKELCNYTQVDACGEKSDSKKTSKEKKRKPRDVREDEKKPSKKPPMKTADDVINRIRWDADLPRENFIIGYIDRFLGIVEKPFTAFSWEDLASVDLYTLAIPRHRIEYFKYRNMKVWDKSQRLDLIFGSTGTPANITELIQTCNKAAEMTEANLSAQPRNPSHESDDELELELGAMTTLQMGQPSHAPSSDRPNYFLCFRVQEDKIVNHAVQAQEHMLSLERGYSDCVIPSVCLHVTVACIGLDDADAVRRCCEVLKAREVDMQRALPDDLSIQLAGVSNFQNRVVYAQVEDSDSLVQFVQFVCTCLEEAEIPIRNQFSYVPHMTLMKVSRPAARRMNSSLVDPSIYARIRNQKFGEQRVTEMHLCSMEAMRQENGFYLSPHCVPLVQH